MRPQSACCGSSDTQPPHPVPPVRSRSRQTPEFTRCEPPPNRDYGEITTPSRLLPTTPPPFRTYSLNTCRRPRSNSTKSRHLLLASTYSPRTKLRTSSEIIQVNFSHQSAPSPPNSTILGSVRPQSTCFGSSNTQPPHPVPSSRSRSRHNLGSFATSSSRRPKTAISHKRRHARSTPPQPRGTSQFHAGQSLNHLNPTR